MMRRKSFFHDNGLSIVLLLLFVLFLGGLALTGWLEYNDEQQEHGAPAATFLAYLGTPDFGEAIFENWESEFLQMGLYVVLTAFLFQRGSAESKDPDEAGKEPKVGPAAPAIVRRGGLLLSLYKCSLSLAFLFLFLFSMAGHAICGLGAANEEAMQHGQAPMTLGEYVRSARFWFESFQNWQSEFLAVFAIVVLSIWLRQQGSPESKPVEAAHFETGA